MSDKAIFRIKIGAALLALIVVFCMVELISRPNLGTARNVNCAGCSSHQESKGANDIPQIEGSKQEWGIKQILLASFLVSLPFWFVAVLQPRVIPAGIINSSLWMIFLISLEAGFRLTGLFPGKDLILALALVFFMIIGVTAIVGFFGKYVRFVFRIFGVDTQFSMYFLTTDDHLWSDMEWYIFEKLYDKSGTTISDLLEIQNPG